MAPHHPYYLLCDGRVSIIIIASTGEAVLVMENINFTRKLGK